MKVDTVMTGNYIYCFNVQTILSGAILLGGVTALDVLVCDKTVGITVQTKTVPSLVQKRGGDEALG